MNLNTYKLTATSDLYKTTYTIRASSLKDANMKAKVKFAKTYRVFGNNVRVGLDPEDLPNHIDEILEKLYNN